MKQMLQFNIHQKPRVNTIDLVRKVPSSTLSGLNPSWELIIDLILVIRSDDFDISNFQ